MVEIGGRPMLWHIMKMRASGGAPRYRNDRTSMHEVISGCRSCGSASLEPIRSLGEVV
jgi:hypothetical protein